MTRLLENYKSNIVEDLKKRLNLNNIHEVPKLTKIVINMEQIEIKKIDPILISEGIELKK